MFIIRPCRHKRLNTHTHQSQIITSHFPFHHRLNPLPALLPVKLLTLLLTQLPLLLTQLGILILLPCPPFHVLIPLRLLAAWLPPSLLAAFLAPHFTLPSIILWMILMMPNVLDPIARKSA